MFELEKSSLFFEQMAREHPTVVQNVEVVQENKVQLDAYYHRPKQFILHLNNLLRSLLFFVEHSVKNSPLWLHDSVKAFLTDNRDQYEILKYLRNVSAHQKLIFPDESLVGGLFRLRSSQDYLLKLGFGDHNKPGKYSWDLALKNTDDIFHDLLVFSSIAFMDADHSALGECLGITRRWYFKVKFRAGQDRFDEIVDVYDLTSKFSATLLDHVCYAYASHKDIVFDGSFKSDLAEHNNINTLLEIDIYPSLFSEWWEEECEPLNFGVRFAKFEGDMHRMNDDFHQWVHKNLTPDIGSYRKYLERFAALEPKEIFDENNFSEFLSFITINHWHFKAAFKMSFMDSPVEPSDVLMLQRLGKVFMEEYRKEKLCTIHSTKEQLNAHISKLLDAIKNL